MERRSEQPLPGTAQGIQGGVVRDGRQLQTISLHLPEEREGALPLQVRGARADNRVAGGRAGRETLLAGPGEHQQRALPLPGSRLGVHGGPERRRRRAQPAGHRRAQQRQRRLPLHRPGAGVRGSAVAHGICARPGGQTPLHLCQRGDGRPPVRAPREGAQRRVAAAAPQVGAGTPEPVEGAERLQPEAGPRESRESGAAAAVRRRDLVRTHLRQQVQHMPPVGDPGCPR
mmetsp:Transcript_38799/g.120699  ORF Transcript_38799/g.120699 Transcript_38799/m.120699 type:complete len:230 (+) Transcript_38799:272-961(+)